MQNLVITTLLSATTLSEYVLREMRLGPHKGSRSLSLLCAVLGGVGGHFLAHFLAHFLDESVLDRLVEQGIERLHVDFLPRSDPCDCDGLSRKAQDQIAPFFGQTLDDVLPLIVRLSRCHDECDIQFCLWIHDLFFFQTDSRLTYSRNGGAGRPSSCWACRRDP